MNPHVTYGCFSRQCIYLFGYFPQWLTACPEAVGLHPPEFSEMDIEH